MKEQRNVGVGRREFLLMSGTAVALATVADRFVLAAPSTAVRGGGRLAVGFVPWELTDPSDASTQLVSRTTAVSARSIGSSDGHFIGDGLRVKVTGYRGSPGAEPNVHLIARVPASGGKMLPVQVWRSGGVSSPTSFLAPVDEHQRIDMMLVLNLNGATPVVSRRIDSLASAPKDDESIQMFPLVLSLQNESDALRLQRGTYLVAFDSLLGLADPDWNSIRVSRTGATTVLEADGFGMKPSKSNFLVISTDYNDPHRHALSNP
jgi:hypothetical protein